MNHCRMKLKKEAHIPKLTPASYRRAFTLIELIVVVAIITILFLISFPLLRSVKDSSNKSVATANIKKELSVWNSYTADHNGYLMPVDGSIPEPGTSSQYWMYWMNEYCPGEVDFTSGDSYLKRDYGFVVSPAKPGPRDVMKKSWLSLNVYMGPSFQNIDPSSFRLSLIKQPSKTVIFGDSVWDIFAHSWYGETGLTARYDNNTTALFGMADGHVDVVKLRNPSDPATKVSEPAGYFYSLTQEAPSP